jgi:hypothetical protein
MKKKLLSLVLVTALALSLVIPAMAAFSVDDATVTPGSGITLSGSQFAWIATGNEALGAGNNVIDSVTFHLSGSGSETSFRVDIIRMIGFTPTLIWTGNCALAGSDVKVALPISFTQNSEILIYLLHDANDNAIGTVVVSFVWMPEVTFYDDDGTTVLYSANFRPGDTPVYGGAPPTKTATAQYTYTFAGWTPAIVPVTGVASYTATYTPTLRSYTVTFYDDDGTTVLDSGIYDYGDTPVYGGAPPTKASTAQYTYAFAGWSPAITTVGGPDTYKATYTGTLRVYTVTYNEVYGTWQQNGLDQESVV